MHDDEFNALGQQVWEYAYNGQSDELRQLMRQQINMRPERWLHPEFRSSPLHAACYSSELTTGCVRLLAEAAGRLWRDKAQRERHQKLVLNLAWPSNGIKIEGVSADGATPLFVACCMRKADALEILLQSRADPTLPNSDGLTPLQVCQSHDDSSCLRLLQRSLSTASSSPAHRSTSPMPAVQSSPIAKQLQLGKAVARDEPSPGMPRIAEELEPSAEAAAEGAAEAAEAAAKGAAAAMKPPAPPNWERASSSVKWIRELGQGSFGKAYEVECGGMTMAAKKLEFLVDSEREEKVGLLRREFRALNRLNHPSILQPLGVVVDEPKSVSLLTELMPLGSLRMMLDKTPELITSDPATQLRLATNIVSAMECLHTQGMQHHDLKSDNLLLKYTHEPGQGQVLVVKIADFGMATGTGSSTLRTTKPTGAGTAAYKAPELFEDDNPPFTNACDVYAFAICVWELITGEIPWNKKGELSLVRALEKNERPPLTASQQATYLGDMAKRCWVTESERRPSFVQLHREINSQPKPELSERQLLVFACSPHVSPLPEAGSEAVSVLLATSWGHEQACSIHWGGTSVQLQEALTARKTRRFLFSGHADATHKDANSVATKTLGFTKPGGDLEIADPAVLAETLGRFKQSLELVFLNGCESLSLGRHVCDQGIPTVVCWSTKTEDGAARLFASEFFALLARGGKTAREAFDGAKEMLTNHKCQVRDRNGTVHDVPKYQMRAPGTPPAPGHSPLRVPWATGLPVLIFKDSEGIKEHN